ncbi:helix-turn-helix transcriptional regulator [Streptomyces sp. MUM 203J]|uniref:LuxR C-terminal-related transcriptional regulator n=1 Tax=Streptomyces sp. MUM 203J TaxID=2791990 RepID=UPI001F048D56|nr:LuxR C-terminal-related transcriptional regulator [Streptomyces sp. MUM 203J]MCH0540854.1 helix-turn-helix transcriptional regulator [Streptomyces sp. MUM 203J]
MPHTSRGSPRGGTAGALTPDGEPVLAVRFAVPGVPETFVHRPRVAECLARAAAGPGRLVLVNGPAGAGKTLLVADWAGTAPGPLVWLTLDSAGNAPGVFWAYVLEAMRHHGLALPEGIGSPARPGGVDDSLLARLAAHLNGRTEPVTLVLDEFERVSAPEVAEGLQFVLRNAGAGLRLVLVSRTEPLLPLHRYRAAGQVTDIRAADLAFRPGETDELARRHGLSLSEEGARALTERTGGWAAGLRLCILAAQHAEDPEGFLKEFETGQSAVADFLLAEVLEAQPAPSQDLLVRTSVCARIHPGMANALTGRDDAALILEQLARANAFVEPVGHAWYRLHPLFAEILRAHLHTRHPGLERELHGVAARWLCDAGLLTEALSHAADAGDWAFAADRLVDDLAIGQLLTGLDADRLGGLFSRMAPDTPGPAADLVRAARALARYDAGQGLLDLDRAEAHLAEAGAGELPAARLSCAVLRVVADRLLGSADRAGAAARLAEELEGQEALRDRLRAHPEVRALRLAALGSAQLWAGRFDTARATLTAVVEASGGPATALPRHEALSGLALIDFLRGWPGRAETHARRATAEAERSGLPSCARTPLGPQVLAAVGIERDDLASARRHLDLTAAPPPGSRDPIAVSWQAVTRSRLLLAPGDPAKALQALQVLDALDATGDMPSAVVPSVWMDAQVALVAAAAHRVRGDPEAAVAALAGREEAGPEYAIASAQARLAAGDDETALALLDGLPGLDGRGPAVTVRALLVRAQAARLGGDAVTARHLATRALALARPERLARPFLDAGPWLRELLEPRAARGGGTRWLPAGLRTEGPTRGTGGPAPVTEPLSDREREVLGLLAQMMSTEEIAAELFLSVNTVKTHLRNIYAKLAATRRGEAVRRARELRLL